MDVTSERGKKCIPTGQEQPQKPNKMNGIGSCQETTTSERRRRRRRRRRRKEKKKPQYNTARGKKKKKKKRGSRRKSTLCNMLPTSQSWFDLYNVLIKNTLTRLKNEKCISISIMRFAGRFSPSPN